MPYIDIYAYKSDNWGSLVSGGEQTVSTNASGTDNYVNSGSLWFSHSELSVLDLESIDSVKAYFYPKCSRSGSFYAVNLQYFSKVGDVSWYPTNNSSSYSWITYDENFPTAYPSTPWVVDMGKWTVEYAQSHDILMSLRMVIDSRSLTQNASIKGVFIRVTYTIKKYTITFKNADGTVLETKTVESGTVPTYTGSMPTKSSTAEYTYAFAGWDKTISAATGDTTYTATFTETKRSYSITVSSSDGGTATGGGTYEYGTSVTIMAEANVGFRFVQWSDGNTSSIRSVTVMGNITYTATFEKIDTMPKFTSVSLNPNPVPAGEYVVVSVSVE